jgi:phosphoribosylanthranilate isomerase
MTQVKICGIRRLDDAVVAADAGADFIGLVFVPERHRRLDTGAAQAIVEGLRGAVEPMPQVVGLFADQPLGEVNGVIEDCRLDLAQLCGRESLGYCSEVRCRVIKVVHVDAAQSGEMMVDALAQRIEAYLGAGHLVTLDRLVEGVQGGTGHSFDWSVAAQLARRGYSFLLAGGLSPENVARAVAMVRPWGVDVSSGVETGSAKDHEKIRAFVRIAKGSSAPSP